MHANQLESHTIPIKRSLIKNATKGSYQHYTTFFAKTCKEKWGKQKEDR